MSNELNGQDLISAFFAALEKRNLARCEAVLVQLQLLSQARPVYAPWCAHFAGILANERDHDWARAERIFSRLLLNDNPNPPLRGRVLLALGRTYDLQGRWADAIQTCERSLPLFAKLGQPVDQAKAWKQMAISYRRGFIQSHFDFSALQRAIEYCQLALATLEPVVNLDIDWLKGTIWNTLGLIYVSLNRWNEAVACYQQELDICRAQDDHFGMGVTYGNLGEVYQKRGNWSEALKAYQQALNLIREFKGQYEEIDVLANLGSLYHDMGELAAALDYYRQAIELIETLRAGVTSEAGQVGYFATVVDTYANTVLLCLAAGYRDEAQAFNYVERARSRTFLDMLAARSPNLSEKMETTIMTLAEVQAALPPDALLLEYFTTGLVEAPEGRTANQTAERHRFPPARTLIFAITRDRVEVRDAGFSPNDLYPRHLDKIVERHFLDPQIRHSLYDRLIAPIEGLLWDKRKLYLVPHGPLHYIPFQALIAPDGETLLRETGPQLIYAPSATLLFRYRPRHSQPPAASCLAIGYNSEGESQLYFAEDEAGNIARLTQGQALIGATPKKATLFSQAADYRLLHLACHGEFDPESPLASFLHLAPDETLTAFDVLEQLRLCCDLVTLSACESGLSRVRRGDELIGLIRAFMYAGSSTLVTTLWRVNDHSTRILMKKFYQEIQTGVGFAEALKQAQLYVKNLGYQEALDILTSLMEDQAGESSDPDLSLPQGRLTPSRTASQAAAYLRGVAATRGRLETREMLPGEATGGQVFADPYFWAAFILVGDDGLEGLGQGVGRSA